MSKKKPKICANCTHWRINCGADWCQLTETWIRAYAKACRLYEETTEE